MMKKLPINGFQTIFIFIGGLMGILPAANCGQGCCSSCFGCAGFGIMAVFLGLWQKIKKSEWFEKIKFLRDKKEKEMHFYKK